MPSHCKGEIDLLRQGPVTSSIGRYLDWKIDSNYILGGEGGRIRLLTVLYIQSISKVGRKMQGRNCTVY